jgi:MHS family proline/betaine transporter-like MFS transporter
VYFGFTLGVTAEVNKKFLAAALGNWLEWYDFGVYAAVPQIIGAHFFASQDPSVQIMQSFMAFAAGYVTRPLGGILIGVVGDRIGRKCALWTSMLLMSLC